MTPNVQTLAHRFAAGRMPLNELRRYGSQLIDCLRHAHEEGRAHGALTPEAVILTPTGVELVPADPAAARRVTPYMAPECLAGDPPDTRSDIFSLGAILYEMFTGRRAFPGDTPEEIGAALEGHTPEMIGETALDRLVSNCLAKDPAARWQRVQPVQLEFRVLLISAKRTQHFSPPRPADVALRSDLRQVEGGLTARLEQRSAETATALAQLSAQLPLLESQLAARLERHTAETAAALRRVAAELPAIEGRVVSRLEEHESALMTLQQSIAGAPGQGSSLTSRMEQQEQAVGAMQRSLGELPQLASLLASRMDEHDRALAALPELESTLTSRLTSRMEQQEQAVGAMQRSLGELPQLASLLASRMDEHDRALAALPELESTLTSRLTSRMEQQEQAVGAMQRSLGELPQLASLLASRMDEHDRALAALPELESSLTSRLTSRMEQQEQAVGAMQRSLGNLPQLVSLIDDHDRALASMPQLAKHLESQIEQHHASVETLSQSVSAAQGQFAAVETKVNAAHLAAQRAESGVGQLADMQGALLDEVKAFGATIQAHAAAIESIRASLTRSDDFMERVVEALESLQSMVLEQARDRVGA